jgi:hypothetical protein
MQDEQISRRSTKIHRHFPKSDFMQTRIVAPKLFAMAKRGLNDAATLGQFAGECFLLSFARFWFPMAVQIKPQKDEDLYQINRAGGAHTGIGRLRLER